MLARLATAALVGLTAHPVGVEVDIGRGLPAVTVVGLGGTAVLEARDRLRAAFGNTGYEWPDRRITVSLPPADLPKQGSGFDLPIAIGLLAAAGWVPPTALEGLWAIGELGLGGDVRTVKGVLPAALAARRSSARLLVVPQANLVEAALVPGLRVAGAASLGQVGEWLVGRADLGRPGPPPDPAVPPVEDLADVRGQHQARRALEIAAAGAHNLLLTGPPGAGKTMLARRLPGLLPPLEQDEALEVTQVFSAAGLLGPDAGLIRVRPFRAPHHAISVPGLVGGGQVPRPGEVSLANHGVLFLDELPEFSRAACEALRQPLEEGEVTVSRAMTSVRFPASFALIAAANPCPCGHLGDSRFACRCSLYDLHRYASRLSGPLLDRIDLYVQAERLTADELTGAPDAEPTALVRARVLAARTLQRSRQGAENGRLASAEVAVHCQVTPPARRTPHGRGRPARSQRPRVPPRPARRPDRRRPRRVRPGRGPPRQGGPQPPPPPDHRRPGGPARMTGRRWPDRPGGPRGWGSGRCCCRWRPPRGRCRRRSRPGWRRAGTRRACSEPTARSPAPWPQRLDALGLRLLVPGDDGWPLAATPPDPPCAWLFVSGPAPPEAAASVAVVGGRRASPLRRAAARSLGAGLARAGWCVVSGGAVGVDAAAHAGALDAGGATVVVLGCGLDVPYPRANTGLFARVRASGGTLASEHPPGSQPRAANFLPRNRLIAALSTAVVVVEAAEDSGSLSTARAAGSRGVGHVLVLPGAPWDPGAAGCNQLIRDGATLVRSLTDILEELGATVGAAATRTPAWSGLEAPARAVLTALIDGQLLTPGRLAAATDLAPASARRRPARPRAGGPDPPHRRRRPGHQPPPAPVASTTEPAPPRPEPRDGEAEVAPPDDPGVGPPVPSPEPRGPPVAKSVPRGA